MGAANYVRRTEYGGDLVRLCCAVLAVPARCEQLVLLALLHLQRATLG